MFEYSDHRKRAKQAASAIAAANILFQFNVGKGRIERCNEILRILWDAPDDPEGNVEHIAEHGLSIEDVEDVLENPTGDGIIDATGRPCVWGYTLEGQYIIVIYDKIDDDTIRVVTAYQVAEPR